LFFFSSRRRHTRSKRDWSSDVCSSDLLQLLLLVKSSLYQAGQLKVPLSEYVHRPFYICEGLSEDQRLQQVLAFLHLPQLHLENVPSFFPHYTTSPYFYRR